jgi:hypothetical protein
VCIRGDQIRPCGLETAAIHDRCYYAQITSHISDMVTSHTTHCNISPSKKNPRLLSRPPAPEQIRDKHLPLEPCVGIVSLPLWSRALGELNTLHSSTAWSQEYYRPTLSMWPDDAAEFKNMIANSTTMQMCTRCPKTAPFPASRPATAPASRVPWHRVGT